MNITLNIEAGNPAELQEAIVGLAGIVGFVTDGVGIQATTKDTQDKPKRAGRSAGKTDKLQAGQDEEKSVAESETKQSGAAVDDSSDPGSDGGVPDNQEPESGGVDIPSIVELRAKAQEIGKTAEGKKAIKALLDKFGSKSLSDVPEEKRADFMDELALL